MAFKANEREILEFMLSQLKSLGHCKCTALPSAYQLLLQINTLS